LVQEGTFEEVHFRAEAGFPGFLVIGFLDQDLGFINLKVMIKGTRDGRMNMKMIIIMEGSNLHIMKK
jgi:hypothetical protein